MEKYMDAARPPKAADTRMSPFPDLIEVAAGAAPEPATPHELTTLIEEISTTWNVAEGFTTVPITWTIFPR
jgi:hypothetical protein